MVPFSAFRLIVAAWTSTFPSFADAVIFPFAEVTVTTSSVVSAAIVALEMLRWPPTPALVTVTSPLSAVMVVTFIAWPPVWS